MLLLSERNTACLGKLPTQNPTPGAFFYRQKEIYYFHYEKNLVHLSRIQSIKKNCLHLIKLVFFSE